MPENEVRFFSNFSSPDNANSSISHSASIDLPITEDMLSWVKVTPIITSQGNEEIFPVSGKKYLTFKEYWEIFGDDELLWKGDLIFDINRDLSPVINYEPLIIPSPINFYTISYPEYNKNKYLWRAKYLDSIFSTGQYHYFPQWTDINKSIPSPPTYLGSRYLNYYFGDIIYARTTTNFILKEVTPPIAYLVWTPSFFTTPEERLIGQELYLNYIINILMPYSLQTIEIKRNIPDVEYDISYNEIVNSSYEKYFEKISDSKFRLHISGNFIARGQDTLYNETSFPVEEATYKISYTFEYRPPPADAYVWTIKYILDSYKSYDATVKKVPTPSNSTMYSRFLITIVNPSNNEEIQRYEL